jgi:hypothetical protein
MPCTHKSCTSEQGCGWGVATSIPSHFWHAPLLPPPLPRHRLLLPHLLLTLLLLHLLLLQLHLILLLQHLRLLLHLPYPPLIPKQVMDDEGDGEEEPRQQVIAVTTEEGATEEGATEEGDDDDDTTDEDELKGTHQPEDAFD